MSESQRQSSQESLRVVGAPEGVDVEQLMAEVRRLVQRRQGCGVYAEPSLPGGLPSAFGMEWGTTLGDQLDLMRAAASLDVRGEEFRSHRRWLGPLIVAWKKFVRFWVRKYTDGLFLRQSFFNTQVVAAIDMLRQRVEVLEDEVAALRERLERQAEPREPDKKNRPEEV